MIHPPAVQRPRSLAVPCIIVFFSGFCIMVLELVASRLVSGYIGMSLYTWTSVIGVILAGISLGNYIGGRLADRFDSKRLVATLFAVSALASLSILGLTHWIGTATSGWTGTEQLWTARVLCVVFGAFLIPGTALGTVSPGIAKWALDYGFATGPTVGTIYAWNTIGSIVGTFVTGFLFFAWFEVTTIVYLVAAALALASLLFIPAIIGTKSSVQRSAIPLGDHRGESLLLPIFLVFVSGFVVMAVELVASRLVAGHIGQSIFTWTSVIGVILAGISLGNYLGGQLADSFESRPLVAALFLLASFTCLMVLPTQHIVDNADEQWMGSTPWWLRVLSVVFGAYFLPATALGTISPAVAKWALDQGYATGRTVGTVYAWNVIGSICGTFATGFVLISTFYVSRILAFSALLLALIAITFALLSRFWLQRIVAVVWLTACLAVTTLIVLPARQFEDAVLTLFPVRIQSLDDQERAFLSNAIDRLDENWSQDTLENSLLAEDAALLREFSLRFKEQLEAVAATDNATPLNEQFNADLHQLRRWAVALEAEMRRQYVHGALYRAVQGLRNRLYDIFEKPEQDRLRRFAKWTSRSEEINVYDQFFYRNDLTYYDESNYYTIQVSEDTVDSNLLEDYETDDDGKPKVDDEGYAVRKKHDVRQLVLDALIHGYLDLSDFSYLHYEYEHIYASVSHRLLRKHRENGEDLRVMFLGGGSYTFPRYLSTYYPEIHCDVAEIDPRVTTAVIKSLGLNQACGKTFLIVDDEQTASVLNEPQTAATILNQAFRLSTPTTAERFASYQEKLKLAGASLWDSTRFDEGEVDYVLDIRRSTTGTTPQLERAAELNVPVIRDTELEKLLNTPSHENVETHIGDARQYIMRNPHEGKYDVIYGDAFNDFSVPAHLTTLEFNRDMARLLKPDGMFMANVIDIWTVSKFMGAYLNTLERVFKHVYLLQTDRGEPSDTRSTFIIICSQVPIELHDLGEREEDIKGLVGSLIEGEYLVPVITGGKGGVPPANVARLTGDGQQTSFPLLPNATETIVIASRTLPTSNYEVNGTELIQFSEPLREGQTVTVRLTGGQEERTTNNQGDSNELPQWTVEVEDADVEFEVMGHTLVTLKDVPLHSSVSVNRTAAERTITLKGDGATNIYPLPKGEIVISEKHSVRSDDYTIQEGNLVFREAPSSGQEFTVHVWTAPDVVLTDNYCPVDNMLSEVAATRAD